MQRTTRIGLAAGAGVLAAVSMLFFPFAGFTERTAYVPSPIFRDYGITGSGTYGQEFNFFGYPAGTIYVQLGVLLGGVVAGVLAVRCWRWLRSAPGDADVRGTVRWVIGLAAAYGVLVIVLFAAVFPGVEDRTIWVTGSEGWVEDWWPAYGLFLTLGALAVMAAGLLGGARREPASAGMGPAPPPVEPPAPPPEG